MTRASFPTPTRRGTEAPRPKRHISLWIGALVLVAQAVSGAQQPVARSPQPEARSPIRIAYVFSDGNLPGTLKAFKSLLQERPDLRGRVALTFLTESVMSDVKVDEITRANVLVLDTMNQQMLERFNARHTIDLIAQVRGHRGKVFGVGEGLMPKETYLKQGVLWDERRTHVLGAHGVLEPGRVAQVRAD